MLKDIYKSLGVLDEYEQIGYEYYKQNGKHLNHLSVSYLSGFENPYDFSQLETEQYSKYIKENQESTITNILKEEEAIPEGVDVVLKKFPRYLDIEPHCHDFFEISYVIKGSAAHTVGDCAFHLKQGDVTIIPPGIVHNEIAEPNCILFGIKIRKSTFDKTFSLLMQKGSLLSAYFANSLYSGKYRQALTFHCGNNTFLPELLIYMYDQQSQKRSHYALIINSIIITFFAYLMQNFEETAEFVEKDNLIVQRMIAVENYIRQNYRTATLVSTAEHFYLTPPYLSSRIKAQTGHTFSQIISRLRLEHAAELLLSTDMKLEQICNSVGYSDTTHFIKELQKGIRFNAEQIPNKAKRE